MSERQTPGIEEMNGQEAKLPLLDDIHHLTFITADMDRLISFYERVFGARITVDLEEEGLRHAFIEVGPHTVLAPLPGSRRRAAGPAADVRTRAARPFRAQRGERGGVPGATPAPRSRGRARQRGDRYGLDAALQFPRPGRGPPRGGLEEAGRPGRSRTEARRVEDRRVGLRSRCLLTQQSGECVNHRVGVSVPGTSTTRHRRNRDEYVFRRALRCAGVVFALTLPNIVGPVDRKPQGESPWPEKATPSSIR